MSRHEFKLILKLIQKATPLSSAEQEKLSSCFKYNNFMPLECEELLSVLNQQSLESGKTGWERLSTPHHHNLLINLLKVVKNQKNMPIQLVDALTKPNHKNKTGCHSIMKENPAALALYLEVIGNDSIAKDKFQQEFYQEQSNFQLPWHDALCKSTSLLLTLESTYPEYTYMNFLTLLKDDLIPLDTLCQFAANNPSIMSLLSRGIYETLLDPAYIEDEKYLDILDNKKVKDAIITHILNLPADKKQVAINQACTPGTSLNYYLANSWSLYSLQQTHEASKGILNILKWIRSRSSYIDGDLLTQIRNNNFSPDERTIILNALNTQSSNVHLTVVESTGWERIALSSHDVLLSLIKIVESENDMPIQLVESLCNLDYNNKTGWYKLIHNAPKALLQYLEIISKNNAVKAVFLRIFSQKNALSQLIPWNSFKNCFESSILSKLIDLSPEITYMNLSAWFKSEHPDYKTIVDAAMKDPIASPLFCRILFEMLLEPKLHKKYVMIFKDKKINSVICDYFLQLSKEEQKNALEISYNHDKNLTVCFKKNDACKLLKKKYLQQKNIPEHKITSSKNINTKTYALPIAIELFNSDSVTAEAAVITAQNGIIDCWIDLYANLRKKLSPAKSNEQKNLLKLFNDLNNAIIKPPIVCNPMTFEADYHYKIQMAALFIKQYLNQPGTLSLFPGNGKIMEMVNNLVNTTTIFDIWSSLYQNITGTSAPEVKSVENFTEKEYTQPVDIDLDKLVSGINAAKDEIINNWTSLYVDIQKNTHSVKSNEKLLHLFKDLNDKIIHPVVRKDLLDFEEAHYIEIQKIARNIKNTLNQPHILALSFFSDNEKIMNVIEMLIKAESIFDLWTALYLYKNMAETPVINIETQESSFQENRVQSQWLINQGIFSNPGNKKLSEEEELEEELSKLVAEENGSGASIKLKNRVLTEKEELLEILKELQVPTDETSASTNNERLVRIPLCN